MKKVVKILILLSIITLAIVILTGCGNKLVATRSSDGVDEKIEIKFKGDTISEVKMTYVFSDSEDAEFMYKLYSGAYTEKTDGFDTQKKGNKVIIKMSKEIFASAQGENPDASKEEIRKTFEAAGYEVK